GAVLTIATTNYSARPWCRTELLIAKEQRKPVVVVDGLQGIEVRSFPYLGNVPLLAWKEGSAGRAIDLLLKELLRQIHVSCFLEATKRKSDHVLTTDPELATMVR